MESIQSNIEEWFADFSLNLEDLKIHTISAKDVVDLEEHHGIVVLSANDFQSYCKSYGINVVIVRKIPSDVHEYVQLYIESSTDDENVDCSVKSFDEEYSSLIKNVSIQCGKWRRCEIFTVSSGVVFLTGVYSEVFEEFLDVLEEFCEKLKLEKMNSDEIENKKREQKINSLIEELLSDEEFRAIRGKRKRCLYVEEKYGDKIPKGGYVKKPDAKSDYMNATLVDLVLKATDRIEIQKSLSKE